MHTHVLSKKIGLFSLPLMVFLIAPTQAFQIGKPSVSTATAAALSSAERILPNQATRESTLLIAQESPPPIRIQFAKNKTSAVVEDAVVRGTRQVYLLGAKARQRMTVKITSLENNAVFDVLSPADSRGRRRTLKQEATSWSSVLTSTGDYQIIVGGTRGNATYKLQVGIK